MNCHSKSLSNSHTRRAFTNPRAALVASTILFLAQVDNAGQMMPSIIVCLVREPQQVCRMFSIGETSMADSPTPGAFQSRQRKSHQVHECPSMSKFESARMVGSYVSDSRTRVLEYAGRHLGAQASNSRLKIHNQAAFLRDTFPIFCLAA